MLITIFKPILSREIKLALVTLEPSRNVIKKYLQTYAYCILIWQMIKKKTVALFRKLVILKTYVKMPQ